MSLTQFKGRGRAYKCVRCGKVDRKGRMVSHVLKHHVPFDRVPYSCSFCSFRCTDKKSLLDHIKKYSRHRDEETRFGQPDYAKILKMAENPYVIGVDDMVQLSKELSVQWHGRHLTQSENPLDDSEGLFEEEEDDVIMSGGLPLPKWLVTSTPSKASATETYGYDAGNQTSKYATPQLFFANKAPYATQLAVQQQLQQQQQQLNLTSHSSNYNVPLSHTTHLPYTEVNLNNNNNKLFLPTLNDVSTPAKIGQGLETINPKDIKNSLESYVMKPLNTPQLNRKTPSQTPLLDEHPTSQLLPQLHLQTSDLDDPLYKEAMADETEPQRKKQKTEEKTTQDEPTSNGNMCDIIMKAAKMISDAIDSNTRAVRQSEKAINKVSEELARIERNVNCIKRIVTQKPNEFEENKENYTQNKKPALKSVVKKA